MFYFDLLLIHTLDASLSSYKMSSSLPSSALLMPHFLKDFRKEVSRSQAVMPELMIWKQISLSHDKDVV
jgi:hypothetical protein